jgi:transcriptional regulator with XRE-family HTH domain
MPQTTTVEVDGDAIRDRRLRAGLDTKQLADAMGISADYLRRLETGRRRRLGTAKYARLCKQLSAIYGSDLLAPHRGDTPQPERK